MPVHDAGTPALHSRPERTHAYQSSAHRRPGEPLADRGIHPDRRPRRPRPGGRPPSRERIPAGSLGDRGGGRVRGLTMAAPFAVASDPPCAPLVWRPGSSLRFLRRLLGISEEKPALARAARAPVNSGLRTFDWDEPDTSLTQAQLEVLK